MIPPITGGSTLNFENFGSPRTPPGLGFDPPHYRGEQPGGVAPPGHFLLPPVPGGAWAGSPPLPGGPGSPTIKARPVRTLMDLTYEGMRPRVPTVMHGVPRILLEAGLPHFMLQLPSYSDDFLKTDLTSIAPPGGVSKHSPEVRQVVFESFEKHPELLQHYLRS